MRETGRGKGYGIWDMGYGIRDTGDGIQRRDVRDVRVEQIAGIQSTKVMCTGTTSCGASDGGLAWAESVAVSKRRK
jgi:hypothetical protein